MWLQSCARSLRLQFRAEIFGALPLRSAQTVFLKPLMNEFIFCFSRLPFSKLDFSRAVFRFSLFTEKISREFSPIDFSFFVDFPDREERKTAG